jgi:alpha-ribazole phosphatase
VVLLLRHCQPQVLPGVCLGQLDVSLTAAGRADADQLSQRLAHYQFEHWICSDLQRAVQTMAPIAIAAGASVRFDIRWRELHMGEFTGRTWDEIHQSQADALRHWGTHFADAGPPGGESFFALQIRVAMALAELAQRTIVVTHLGAIQAARAYRLGLDAAQAMQFQLGYGEWVVL